MHVQSASTHRALAQLLAAAALTGETGDTTLDDATLDDVVDDVVDLTEPGLPAAPLPEVTQGGVVDASSPHDRGLVVPHAGLSRRLLVGADRTTDDPR